MIDLWGENLTTEKLAAGAWAVDTHIGGEGGHWSPGSGWVPGQDGAPFPTGWARRHWRWAGHRGLPSGAQCGFYSAGSQSEKSDPFWNLHQPCLDGGGGLVPVSPLVCANLPCRWRASRCFQPAIEPRGNLYCVFFPGYFWEVILFLHTIGIHCFL